jgi:hypothetical protein
MMLTVWLYAISDGLESKTSIERNGRDLDDWNRNGAP